QKQDYELSKSPQAFDTNASTTMRDSDECGGKMGWIELARAATSGTVSPVHQRFAHFRQRHVDANDGPKLGHERTYEQGDSAWAGQLRCGLASVDTRADGRLIG